MALGSSPLARGLPAISETLAELAGIIPARAGFTPHVWPAPWPGWDHPRSRGVYTWPAANARMEPGSSPLARGLPRERAYRRDPHRIIPARAGFTTPTTPAPRPTGDHPRSRGVYRHWACEPQLGRGSSPLARGLQTDLGLVGELAGIIPARAGFTRRRDQGSVGRSDHPRSRGVYDPLTAYDCHEAGSSPLARGLPPAHRCAREDSGIIPARAGFTTSERKTTMKTTDHPRSRGVYVQTRCGTA